MGQQGKQGAPKSQACNKDEKPGAGCAQMEEHYRVPPPCIRAAAESRRETASAACWRPGLEHIPTGPGTAPGKRASAKNATQPSAGDAATRTTARDQKRLARPNECSRAALETRRVPARQIWKARFSSARAAATSPVPDLRSPTHQDNCRYPHDAARKSAARVDSRTAAGRRERTETIGVLTSPEEKSG